MVSGFMLYALWLVLIAIGLNLVMGVYQAFASNSFDIAKLGTFLRTGILFSVFPLFVIAYLSPLDPTGFLLKSGYYIGAMAVFITYIIDAFRKVR